MNIASDYMDNEEKVFENAQKNLKFFDDNFKSFESKFPNRFVAVSGANLVATSETVDDILEKVKERKIDESDLLIEFIPLPGSILVL